MNLDKDLITIQGNIKFFKTFLNGHLFLTITEMTNFRKLLVNLKYIFGKLKIYLKYILAWKTWNEMLLWITSFL